MTDRELKHLRRAELLEMLINKSSSAAAMEERMRNLQAQLDDRYFALDNAGSIAEASLWVNGVFDAVQGAAQQYKQNMEMRQQACEEKCKQVEEEARQKAQQMLEETRVRCEQMEHETQLYCEELRLIAEQNAQGYWTELFLQIQQLRDEGNKLRKMLGSHGRVKWTR